MNDEFEIGAIVDTDPSSISDLVVDKKLMLIFVQLDLDARLIKKVSPWLF